MRTAFRIFKYPALTGFVFHLAVLWMLSGCMQEAKRPDPAWPAVTKTCRPWTYWWWMGSAVDKQNLSDLLEMYSKAGIGGVHIIPIYGVKEYEDRFIDYLSPEWMEMLEYTAAEAARFDLGVDLSTGTGWPFGGPRVHIEDADSKVLIETFMLDAGARLDRALEKAPLQALIAFSDQGEAVDLTGKVDGNGVLDWTAPPGKWELFAVSQGFSGRDVKRAAPGGEGYAVNPFSRKALMHYLPVFEKAFSGCQGDPVRAFYHDSFEYGGNWTPDLLAQFERRRGYDLRRHLPALLGRGPEDVVARVKSDYRETIADLLLEDFIVPWVAWVHERGCVARNQAHGSPGNLIDLYAAADIPETEIFGPSGFEIPGLRTDQDFHGAAPDPLMLKFASSAAHVAGRRLVSSESCTWLGEHFRVSLSQIKPEIDQLLISGVNHVFYHGMAYSPADDPWPGWLFYASTNFAPSNSFWRDFPALNAYITRCQSFLQSGKPAHDILLYFPIHDIRYDKEGMLLGLQVHNLSQWFYGTSFHEAASTLWEKGYTFDYISDRLLARAEVSGDFVLTGDTEYRAVVIPDCHFMPLGTLETLLDLAEKGATILVQGNLPRDVPGLGDLDNRRKRFQRAMAALHSEDSEPSGIRQVNCGKGRFLVGGDLEAKLELAHVAREPVVDYGIEFIRRTSPEGYFYFMTNLSGRALYGWVTLGVKANSAVLFDPRSSRCGIAGLHEDEAGATEVYLQLQPGESCILRTYSSQKITGPGWKYLHAYGEPLEIKGSWNVTFIDGGPVLPPGFKIDTPASWTEFSGPDTKSFSGTAKYTILFNKPAEQADDWILDLGRVCESARVRINGRSVGTLWSFPFRVSLGEALREGQNTLEIEVTNLGANRIAELDRQKVPWKKFYNINFVDIKYRPFDASNWPPMDSGLIGPVRLIPCRSACF